MDEMAQDEHFFCERCGIRLINFHEVAQGICDTCWDKSGVKKGQKTFVCKICGKRLPEMREIAQGICDPCKAAILRKLK